MLSIDAMGGDKGPKVVIDGIARSLKKYSDTNFIIHGQKSQLSPLIESHPEVARKIEELMTKFNSEQNDPLFPASYEVPIMIDKYDGQKFEEGDEYLYWSN